MTQNLPYRLREGAFRFYQADITKIVLNFPEVQVFHPSNVETFSNRLRDAMKSLHENKWLYEYTNLFVKSYPEIRVSIRNTSVIAGGKDHIRTYDRGLDPKVNQEAPKPVSQIVIQNADDQSLDGLFRLHHNRLLTSQTRLRFDDPKEFLASIPKWEASYDIAIEQVTPNEFNVL